MKRIKYTAGLITGILFAFIMSFSGMAATIDFDVSVNHNNENIVNGNPADRSLGSSSEKPLRIFPGVTVTFTASYSGNGRALGVVPADMLLDGFVENQVTGMENDEILPEDSEILEEVVSDSTLEDDTIPDAEKEEVIPEDSMKPEDLDSDDVFEEGLITDIENEEQILGGNGKLEDESLDFGGNEEDLEDFSIDLINKGKIPNEEMLDDDTDIEEEMLESDNQEFRYRNRFTLRNEARVDDGWQWSVDDPRGKMQYLNTTSDTFEIRFANYPEENANTVTNSPVKVTASKDGVEKSYWIWAVTPVARLNYLMTNPPQDNIPIGSSVDLILQLQGYDGNYTTVGWVPKENSLSINPPDAATIKSNSPQSIMIECNKPGYIDVIYTIENEFDKNDSIVLTKTLVVKDSNGAVGEKRFSWAPESVVNPQEINTSVTLRVVNDYSNTAQWSADPENIVKITPASDRKSAMISPLSVGETTVTVKEMIEGQERKLTKRIIVKKSSGGGNISGGGDISGGGGTSSGGGGTSSGGGNSSGGGGTSGGSSSEGSSQKASSSSTSVNSSAQSYKGSAGNDNTIWTLDSQGWRLKINGSDVKSGWAYADWQGKMSWYLFDSNGYMLTGWQTDHGRTYYLHAISDGTLGHMYTGWHQIEGKDYYFSESNDETLGMLVQDNTR